MAIYEIFHGSQPLMMAVDRKIPQRNILVNFREKMGNGRIKWQWKSFIVVKTTQQQL